MKTLPDKYFIYETSYGSDIPVDQLYAHTFDCVPSKYINNKSYKKDIINYFISIGYLKESEIIENHRKYVGIKVEQYYFVNKKNKTTILISSKNESNEISYRFSINYSTRNCVLEDIINQEELKKYEIELKKKNISLIKSEMGHLDLEEYDLNIPDMDLELNYGLNFLKLHETIIKRLNNPNDKGIVLFHGSPGTGKTSYIKYLTRLITNKEILFIPPSMAETLSEPSIIPFLMEHKNSILIIEDAEKVISDRDVNGSSIGVSNILNLTDGILGDCLNIQIVATFNMKREKIDQALLRKGRLIAEHKFTPLSVEESNKLLIHNGSEKRVDKPTSLADIYNIDEDLIRVEDNQKIGFKNN